jgi:hypothetical protein
MSLGLMSVLLASCAPSNVLYGISDYQTDLSWKEDFVVCQLNDLHVSTSSNVEEEIAYFDKILKLKTGSYPDLIVLNGDTFMDSNRKIVDDVIGYFDSLDVPFAFTYGNHDLQGFYSDDYINEKLLSAKNSVYKNPSNKGTDDVYGRSNYFVNLKDGDELKWQLYFLDSNTYYGLDYDVIHDDQIEWYERALLESNGYVNKPETIDKDTFKKSLMFFHIPTPEFKTAVDNFKSLSPESTTYQDQYCDMREGVSSGTNKNMKKNIVSTIGEYKSTVSIGVAHDHINNTDLRYENNDWITHLTYGLKSSRGIYHDEDIVGAAFYTLHSNPIKNSYKHDVYFDLDMITLKYNEDISKGVNIWSTENK